MSSKRRKFTSFLETGSLKLILITPRNRLAYNCFQAYYVLMSLSAFVPLRSEQKSGNSRALNIMVISEPFHTENINLQL